ncbi:MAG: hypothetical protein HOP29_14675 [Phycisphaerales bacterium]|nr:hypothetical protein [Phycisphaerales bacterium]
MQRWGSISSRNKIPGVSCVDRRAPLGVIRRRVRSSGIIALSAAVVFTVGPGTGCTTKPKRVNTATQQPLDRPRPAGRNGYEIIAAAPAGMFPCALAVASVAETSDTLDARPMVELVSRPSSESVAWLELFDDSAPVIEVFPATVPNQYGRTLTVPELLNKARTEGAGLCLVYQATVHGDAFADVQGLLYRTADGQLLARIQAQADAPPVNAKTAPPPGRADVDRRHIDPAYVAVERFQNHVRECLRYMMHDTAVGLTAGGARGLRQRMAASPQEGPRLGSDRDR